MTIRRRATTRATASLLNAVLPDQGRQDHRASATARLRVHRPTSSACTSRGARFHRPPTACASPARSRRARSSSAYVGFVCHADRLRATIRSISSSTTWPANSPPPSGNSVSASATEILEGNGGASRQGLHHATCDAAQVPGLGRQVPDHAGERHRGRVRQRQSSTLKGVGGLDTLGLIARLSRLRSRAHLRRLRRGVERVAGREAQEASTSCSSTRTTGRACWPSARDTEKLWAQIEFVW